MHVDFNVVVKLVHPLSVKGKDMLVKYKELEETIEKKPKI